MTPYLGVLGTWAWQDGKRDRDWRAPGTPFHAMMQAAGFVDVFEADPFDWTGDVDGLPWSGNDWEVFGDMLARRLRDLELEQRRIVAHSHGGPVALRAALSLPIHSLLTIGTPAHRQTRAWGAEALRRGHVGRWLHVHDRKWDTWGALGAMLDWSWRGQWRWPFIDRRMALVGMQDLQLDGVGHSRLLYAPRADLWESAGLFAALR